MRDSVLFLFFCVWDVSKLQTLGSACVACAHGERAGLLKKKREVTRLDASLASSLSSALGLYNGCIKSCKSVRLLDRGQGWASTVFTQIWQSASHRCKHVYLFLRIFAVKRSTLFLLTPHTLLIDALSLFSYLLSLGERGQQFFPCFECAFLSDNFPSSVSWH